MYRIVSDIEKKKKKKSWKYESKRTCSEVLLPTKKFLIVWEGRKGDTIFPNII